MNSKLSKIEKLLENLNYTQTQDLVKELVKKEPSLLETIENWIENNVSKSVSIKSSTPSINTRKISSQVIEIIENGIKSIEYGWDEEDPLGDELYNLINETQTIIEEGEFDLALKTLEAITSTCAYNWDKLDDYGIDNDDFVNLLDQAFCEVFLSIQLDESQKSNWINNLESWQDEWSAEFLLSLTALKIGWDDPLLQKILLGEVSSLTEIDNENCLGASHWSDRDLTIIRLKVLESQNLLEEYLYLAKATGEVELYLNRLAHLGRIESVKVEAQQLIRGAEEALSLAKILEEKSFEELALTIAKQGLTKDGKCLAELLRWTIKLAEKLNDPETILMAQIKIFQTQPSLEDYQKLEQLAAENWSTLRLDLLAHLQSHQYSYGEREKVSILIYEKLIDEAIALIEKNSYLLTPNVLEKIILFNPDWVILQAIPKAEDLMNSGNAKHYEKAVEWLKQAHDAYKKASKNQEWKIYYQKITEIHSRKRKLIGLLKSLL